jgi:hypothetical protein
MKPELKSKNMWKSKFPTLSLWIAFIALFMGWTGCSKAGLTSTGSNQTSTYVVLMNMAPFAPSTEIYLNDIKSTSPISPGNYSTSYAHLIAGDYDVKFKMAGSDSLLAELASSAYDSSAFYTLILYNDDTVSKMTKAVKIFDDYSSVTGVNASFRFFNLSPGVGPVDVYLNSKLLQQGRAPADFASYASQYTLFQPVIPASYTLEVTKAGTDSVIAHLNDAYFQAGNAYTVFLSGIANNPNFPVNVHVAISSY